MPFRWLLLVCFPLAAFGGWNTEELPGEDTGKRIEVMHDGKPVARFVYGEGQLKPYLHVYGKEGELLTEWSPEQQFPHHRGIYIGWNRIRSDLGSADLWHLRSGERMEVAEVRHSSREDGAVILARIEWHAQKEDERGESILINEMRRLEITQPEGGKTQVDAKFTLVAMRDLALDGDLQHAGIHFRGSHELLGRAKETRYVWEPDLPGNGGRVVDQDLKWCRLIFPIGTNWYSATELDAPSNPTTELSWRDYGRFGFFFKKKMKWGDALEVNYRFIMQPAGEPSDGTLAKHRSACEAEFERYLQEGDIRRD